MGAPFMPPDLHLHESREGLPLFQESLRFAEYPLLFDEGAAVVHAAVVVHARHCERRQGLEAHAELGLVGLDLFKQRFEVLLAFGGAPDLVFDAGELLGNPIDYLTDIVVPALDLVSCRLARLGGFWR